MDETGGGDAGTSAGAAETAANDNVAPPEAANDNIGAQGPSDAGVANTDAGAPPSTSPEATAESRAEGQPDIGAGTPVDIGAGGPRESVAVAEQPSHDGSSAREAANDNRLIANDNRPEAEQTAGGEGQAANAAARTGEAGRVGDITGDAAGDETGEGDDGGPGKPTSGLRASTVQITRAEQLAESNAIQAGRDRYEESHAEMRDHMAEELEKLNAASEKLLEHTSQMTSVAHNDLHSLSMSIEGTIGEIESLTLGLALIWAKWRSSSQKR